ncbi:hypothetical protein GCM10010302_32440 [Streptomyces polychromogenes]|uniref:Transposase IS4-like domain-containing protein n=1 Tax=Streptomyces polychromogenes TaxID=67342 RepID=A0ABN0VEI1_9ACTN
MNKPVRLWWSRTRANPEDVDRWRQAFLRWFYVEHTFRLLKQTPGWTRPKPRDSAAADRWTWLALAAHPPLRLARPLARDLRRPWERPAEPHRLPRPSPPGFRNLRAKTGTPARAPKPTRPGPGRPPGSKNRRPPPDTTWNASSPQAGHTPDPHSARRGRTKSRRTTNEGRDHGTE